jgi:Predicted dehydrogenases and related proteins
VAPPASCSASCDFVSRFPVHLAQRPLLPRHPRPIVAIGAGSVVRAAHLPAYRLAGFSVVSVFDLVPATAAALARDFGIPRVCASLDEAVRSAPPHAVFDLATPAEAILATLKALPEGAAVLIQKPPGLNLADTRAIMELCRRKRFTAAVNLQLRYMPAVLAIQDAIRRGELGEIHDVEVRLTCCTPWRIWKHLFGIPRMEIVYHSIHYVDIVRAFLGDPAGVWAKTVKDPAHLDLASTRTTIAFDYGDVKRATITTNHAHGFGPKHEESYLKIEGTRGAAKARLGINLGYPHGVPDTLEICRLRDGTEPQWENIPLEGGWIPQAFMGTMASVMCRADGETDELPTSIEDACHTMAVIEACYESSARGATPIPSVP